MRCRPLQLLHLERVFMYPAGLDLEEIQELFRRRAGGAEADDSLQTSVSRHTEGEASGPG